MTDAKDLKNFGLKATMPRMKVLDVFHASSQRHLSAEDVYRALMGEDMDVSIATVYRILGQFETAGLLKRNYFESGKAVFELNEGVHHDHLVCLDCGQVTEFCDVEIERRQEKIARDNGFEIREHALSIYGSCTRKDCPSRPRR